MLRGSSMNRSILAVTVFMTLSLLACGRGTDAVELNPPCIDRSSDGPWYDIGKAAPKRKQIAAAYDAEGEAGLRKLLGAPHRESDAELVWIYEKRRECTRVSCDPPTFHREYDQAFSITRMVKGESPKCMVEMREFIQETTLTPDEALELRAPLSSPPRECRSGTNR